MVRIFLYLSIFFFTLPAAAQRRGVVDVSVAHMREEPSYTAEMGTEEFMGREVEITDEKDYWLRVTTLDGYQAWTNRMCVAEMDREALDSWHEKEKYICLALYSAIYGEPDAASVPVSDLVRGDIMVREEGRAVKGFVRVSTPSGKKGWVRKKDVKGLDAWTEGISCTEDAIVREALLYAGIPYLWGGASVKGFDCSGLVKTVFMMNGISLPRNASAQAREGEEIDITAVRGGDCSALRKGDLIFFGNTETGRVTHVGIYIGDSRMVHSSQLTRINSLRPGDPDCYENVGRMLGARRIKLQKD